VEIGLRTQIALSQIEEATERCANNHYLRSQSTQNRPRAHNTPVATPDLRAERVEDSVIKALGQVEDEVLVLRLAIHASTTWNTHTAERGMNDMQVTLVCRHGSYIIPLEKEPCASH